jgi:Uncharacterized protein conserved in bacteria
VRPSSIRLRIRSSTRRIRPRIKRAAAPQQALLKKAQQAWIALRDADCAFIGSGTEGGSVQPMIVNQCLAEKTMEREAFLASLMQCEEGNLSCPLSP